MSQYLSLPTSNMSYIDHSLSQSRYSVLCSVLSVILQNLRDHVVDKRPCGRRDDWLVTSSFPIQFLQQWLSVYPFLSIRSPLFPRTIHLLFGCDNNHWGLYLSVPWRRRPLRQFFLNPVWCWENIYCSWLRFSVAHAKTWQKFLCAAVLACPSFSTDRWKDEKCVTRDVVYSARKSSSCADTRHTNWGILVFSRLSVWFTECDRNVCGTTNEEEHECDSTFHHLV